MQADGSGSGLPGENMRRVTPAGLPRDFATRRHLGGLDCQLFELYVVAFQFVSVRGLLDRGHGQILKKTLEQGPADLTDH